MTKQRKLAIEMWRWIRDRYDEWNDYFWGSGDDTDFAMEMKCEFWDAEHNGEQIPKWRGFCWLCQYTQNPDTTYPFNCLGCPLKSCSKKDSAYYVINTHQYKGDIHVTEEVFRNCCSTILYALGYEGD